MKISALAKAETIEALAMYAGLPVKTAPNRCVAELAPCSTYKYGRLLSDCQGRVRRGVENAQTAFRNLVPAPC